MIREIFSSQETFALSRWVFLRLLGLIYLAAFVSFGTQALGLIGSRGILPLADILGPIRDYYGAESFTRFPTVFWLDSSDAFLQLVCLAGVSGALLLAAGIAQLPALILLWALYLSIVTAGQVFMGYQWDALLLETGFLAIFLAPLTWRPHWPRRQPARLVLLLFYWLLFRLMLSSGLVKLLSGDPAWRDLTALAYHYETQPLPTPLAWFAHHLPLWFQRLSTLAVFIIELAAPLLIFLPWRRLRMLAAALFTLLQILILLTGNYTFFNLLTVALCILLLDDRALRRLVPTRWRARLPEVQIRPAALWRLWAVGILAVVMFVLAGARLLMLVLPLGNLPPPLPQVVTAFAPFEVVNSYGLFAVMTTTRPEIIVEGSDDGQTWLAYEFPYKPGDVERAPRWVAPYQPRLDWQMWFAALGSYQQNPWFARFLQRLLEGSPDVLALLAENPFPDAPPRYVRAVLYEYRFSAALAEGAWWQRTEVGLYAPVVTLNR